MGFNKAIYVFLGLVLLGSGIAMAISNATTDYQADLTRWDGNSGAAGSWSTEGGNISANNLNGTSLTDRWAGFYGNVTGTIYLTDAANAIADYLFMWTGADNGVVCASTNLVYPFSGAVVATKEDIDTAWSFTTAAADNASNTFTGTTCDITFNSPAVTVTNTAGAKNATYSPFETCAIVDGVGTAKDNTAFCTILNSTGVNYANLSANYELIVPTVFGTGTETYYFYAEVN